MTDLERMQKEYRDGETRIKGIRAKAFEEKRDITADELAEGERLVAHLENLKPKIDGELRMLSASSGDTSSRSLVDSGLPGGLRGANRRNYGKVGAKYEDLFGPVSDSGGFDTLDDYVLALQTRDYSRLKRVFDAPKAGERRSTPAEGWFLVPDFFSKEIFDNGLELELVRPRATTYAMQGDTLKIPGWVNNDHSVSVYGGVVAAWVAEGGEGNLTQPQTRGMVLTARKLIAYAKWSSELIEDASSAYGINPFIGVMSKAISFYLEEGFWNGNGAAGPLGILNCPCLVVVPKVTGQSADTISYANVVGMYARQANPGNAIWVASRDCVPQLLTLGVPVGTGGAFVPAVIQSEGVFSLLGRPLYFSEHLKPVGDQGDIAFVDVSSYAIGLRSQIQLVESAHVNYMTDEIVLRARLRADGQGLWDLPVTPKNGGATQSPFVVLAVRA